MMRKPAAKSKPTAKKKVQTPRQTIKKEGLAPMTEQAIDPTVSVETLQPSVSKARPERDVTPQRAANRPERTPMYKRDRISFKDQDPNYMYRFVNDVDDRLERFEEGGYEFVRAKQKVGDPIVGEGGAIDSRISKPVGAGVRGYLMRIKKEWYDEDQKAKLEQVQASERAIKPGTNQYIPDGMKQAVTDT